MTRSLEALTCAVLPHPHHPHDPRHPHHPHHPHDPNALQFFKRFDLLLNSDNSFFKRFDLLLNSDNYVTRRQAIKLLGELLLDRANMQVMLRYIGEAHNFKIMMTLIKDPSRAIQYEAFHVFKIFVANPRKPEKIVKLLARNKEKMVKFLKDFEIDKEEEDFEEEKEMLIREIQNAHYPGLG
ncbi:unnamed protein product [Closterium sp. NIES-54]